MKAFQLKIVIKNSKPPIWRRVIVPAGITFSQLSMILNEVMGWSGTHLFEFEFYHQELKISEDIGGFDIGYGPFDFLPANTVFIREYLEENDWFTYTYDFGDDWQHRVTIEKIVTDYELDYPQVIKYKGNCPPEDCGGIYGFYELMNEEMDENDPEYEDWIEWKEMQDPPKEYDMAEVNKTLQKYYFYKWGKAEKRTQSEIYEDHFKGKYGLNATKRNKNKNAEMVKSQRHQVKEAIQLLADMLNDVINNEMLNNEALRNTMITDTLAANNMFQADAEWKRKVHEKSLKSIFYDFSKEELVRIAKKKGIKGVSKCNKQTLAENIADYMLKPEMMEWYFRYLTDKEIEVFERLIENPEEQEWSEAELLEKLYQSQYIGMMADGTYVVTKDVAETYLAVKGEEFEQKRAKKSYLLTCIRAAGILYGIAPLNVILDMTKTNPNVQMTEQEVRSGIENLPPEFNEYVVAGDKVYHEMLYPNDRGLLSAQAVEEYYIPTMEEILDLGTIGYLPEQKELKSFIHFLTHQFGILKEQAEYVGMQIQIKICGDCESDEIFEILASEGVYIENKKQLNKLAGHLSNLWNNTRMLLNRGFTPTEVLRKEGRLSAAERCNVVSFEQAKKNKIYPNEPCPCGSGKKYKNCCGKK